MRLKSGFISFLAFLATAQVSADLQYLPDVPDYSVLREFDDAFYQHFRSRQLTVEKVSTYSVDDFSSFRVTVAGQRHYVRLVRNDCNNCSFLRFDQEWLLKQDVEPARRLAEFNIYRVLPESAATFVFQRKRHYLTSFPLMSGMSLSEIYRQAQFSSPYLINASQQHVLGRLFYRLGQTIATFGLDPSLPSESSKELLQRGVKIRLSDRTARNQLYNQETGAVFFVELVASEKNPLKHQNVERLVRQWFSSYLNLVDTLNRKNRFECGRKARCITDLFQQFLSGFQSVLPVYNQLLLKNILTTLLKEQLSARCHDLASRNIFCVARDQIAVSRYFRLK